MRVRQKLLEHVAAALTMPSATIGVTGARTQGLIDERGGGKGPALMTMIPNRHISMGEDTPPRSPVKEQTQVPSPDGSPERLALPLRPQTQSLQEQDEATARMSKESIRIYADSEVYALLADVQAEINRMSAVKEESLEILNPVVFSRPVPSRTVTPVGN